MNRQPSTPTNTRYNQEITHLSASALIQAIAGGDISASEAVEAHIARIEQVNPQLNAVVVKRYAAAHAEAQAADEHRKAGDELGLLHGLPVTIKDSLDLTDTQKAILIRTAVMRIVFRITAVHSVLSA